MIKIKRDFEDLAIKHFHKIKNEIFNRIFDKSKCPISTFLSTNLKSIVTGKPSDIIEISDRFNSNYGFFKSETFVKKYNYGGESKTKNVNKLEYIFFYKEFALKGKEGNAKYNAYELAKILDIRVCPYCNRNYTNTIEKGKNKFLRPDFDHFFSQKDHPILALSFYNLIPSCQICNSRLKGDTEFNLKDYFHPYINGFEDEVSFNYSPNSTLGAYGVQNKFSIFFEEKSHKYSDKLKGSQGVFKYKEIYEHHGDFIEELVAKIYKGSQTYLDSVRASFPGLNMSAEEMYRLAYGNYMDEKDHEKRPFAKLTKDIFDKLGPDLIL